MLLLDVMLPEGQDAGFLLGQQLRERGVTTPILYLTARSTLEDRARSLTTGDDYLGKPFDFPELRARVYVLLRRSAAAPQQDMLALPGGWLMSVSGREVTRAGGRADLTRREFLLLELLALHRDRVLPRGEIIECLWGGHLGVEQKVIDVYVSTLRRKLGDGVWRWPPPVAIPGVRCLTTCWLSSSGPSWPLPWSLPITTPAGSSTTRSSPTPPGC